MAHISLHPSPAPTASILIPPSSSRFAHPSSSASSKPSSPSTPTSSSFLSRMPSFPLFSTAWGTKESDASGSPRDRRFSFGGAKGKGKAEHSAAAAAGASASADLKRSRSARTSLVAAARRLSTQRRAKDFPPISRPVLAQRNGLDEDPSSYMRDYRERAHVFATSSPELATPGEEKPQWAAFATTAVEGQPLALPHSPMVKWAPTAGSSSFAPLSPRPFSASSSAPSADSAAHFSEGSTASSAGPETPELSASPAGPQSPIRHARLPKAQWELPAFPPPRTPPPHLPTERAVSPSPNVDEDARNAARAEALAKLTSPTPTGSRFPDDLSSFPFPDGGSAADGPSRCPPPRPTRPLPAAPLSATSTSLILLLPSARTSILPEGTPPPLVRSNTVGLHPSPVPLDIDFRGKLVRARNSHPADASPSLTISSSSSFGAGSSPGSRFSEWSAPPNSRKSSETSLTFSLGTHEQEAPPPAKGGLYALAMDRRMVESAVDVLAIVEEDEAPLSAAPAVRVKRSPSKQSPARRTSSSRKRISLDSSLSPDPSSDVLVIPRQRSRPPPCSSATLFPGPSDVSGKPARPFRLSQTDRTFSSGPVLEATRNEKDELGFHAVTPPILPFPIAAQRAASPPRVSPQRPRAGKRCLSEVHAGERPLAGDGDKPYGLGLGLPSSLAMNGGRTRHQSLAIDEEDVPAADLRQRKASRRVSSGAATRTRLVLREKGQEPVTYQLGEAIGRGQFGSVYRALNLNTGAVVAVKRIQLDGKTDAEINELSKEVSLLQRLDHPGIVRYEGVARTEHYLNIVLEYVENGSLQGTLKQFGQLPENLVASYVVQILEGLSYLHEQGVVHCDLKAANILSNKRGVAKLSDFGVSLNLHAIKATKGINAGANEANGTPNWMAPEIIALEGATAASDIWSLGATVIELIEGKPPYADLVTMSAMFRIVEDELPPLPERGSDELKAFLRRCFRKNPRERPTAEELFQDPWLLKHCDPTKSSRPQDSLPFARRLSSDYRRPTLQLPSMHTILNESTDDLVASPLPMPVMPIVQDEPRGRDSLDSGYRASTELTRSPEPSTVVYATEETARPHSFVKTSFSKAIECKVCGEQTKRHAVLCKDCGLISHSRCKDWAPTCDLRAQLLGLRHPIPLAPTLSIAPSIGPHPTASPSSFNLSDYLPFGKSRRPKPPTPSSSHDSHLPTTTFSPVPPTQSRATGAIRHLSNALLPTKTRTPEHTPPSSLSRGASGKRQRPHSHSVSAAEQRGANASESSLSAAESAVSPPPGRVSLDIPRPLGHKLSHHSVVQRPNGDRALAKKKSHGRAVSQPVNGAAKASKGGWLSLLSPS
ncbi:hypothetical protein JCM10213_007988 [Rhodosporidiobolus nylandii]